ncbi:MAG: hypothetical protein IJW29_09720 [Clostridia bacterium]|nr:hypothetical protein [Clostridia bacterium]
MKKLLSLLLAICLCAVCFVGCNEGEDGTDDGKNLIKVEDVKKDPYGAVQNASEGVTGWLTDDAEVAAIIADALANGSVELVFESDALFSMMGAEGLESIKGTVYSDATNGKGALEVLVGMNGAEMGGILYVGEGGVALNSAALLNTENTYMIKLASLLNAELFEASLLPALIQIPEEEMADVLSSLGMVGTLLDELALVDWASQYTEVSDAMYGAMRFNVSAGSIKDAAGKTVSCAVVSVTVDEASVVAMLKAAIDAVSIPENIVAMFANGAPLTEADIKAVLKVRLDEAIADGSLDLGIEPATTKYYVSLKSGKLVGTQAIMTEVDEEYGYSSTSTTTILYNENGVVVKMMEAMDGYESGMALTLAKTEKNGVVNYKLTMDMVMDSFKQTMMSLNASYTKASGALMITASVSEGPTIELGGALLKSDSMASIAFNTLKVKNVEVQDGITTDVTVDLFLSLTFNKGTAVPTIPEDAKDIVTMTEEDWNELMSAYEGSLLATIVAQIMGGMDDGGIGGGSVDMVVRKPSYIPEGMIEEEWWNDFEGACYAYGYEITEDGETWVETSYYFTCYGSEEYYENSFGYYAEDDSYEKIPMTLAGQSVTAFMHDEFGTAFFWTDGEGYYLIELWDESVTPADLEAIIASVQ